MGSGVGVLRASSDWRFPLFITRSGTSGPQVHSQCHRQARLLSLSSLLAEATSQFQGQACRQLRNRATLTVWLLGTLHPQTSSLYLGRRRSAPVLAVLTCSAVAELSRERSRLPSRGWGRAGRWASCPSLPRCRAASVPPPCLAHTLGWVCKNNKI